MWAAIIVIGFFVIVGLAVMGLYNSLVTKRNVVKKSWANIDTLLQKRFDLVPNLVETVKAYAAHEQETFEMVTKARSQWQNAQNVNDVAEAEGMLQGALKSMFAVAESYPDLKANENFMMLQEELAGIEKKIAYSRQRYNNSVMSFNTAIQKFPAVIIANSMGFQPEEYFEIDEPEAREAVKVEF